MAVTRLDIISLVRAKAALGSDPDEIRDPIVEAAVDEASELILNYINRKEMPSACKFIWAAIATDIYKYNIADFDIDDKADKGDPSKAGLLRNVSEIRIDDAIVSDEITGAKYQAKSQSAQAKLELDFLKNYRERLHRFRLIQWRQWRE